jgi:hypothetical protein
MWKLVSGKVVNDNFHGQWLSKGNTTHLATFSIINLEDGYSP